MLMPIFIRKLVPWNRKLGDDSWSPWLVPQSHAYGTFLRACSERVKNLHLNIPLTLLLRRPDWRQNLVPKYRPETNHLPVAWARFLLAAKFLPKALLNQLNWSFLHKPSPSVIVEFLLMHCQPDGSYPLTKLFIAVYSVNIKLKVGWLHVIMCEENISW